MTVNHKELLSALVDGELTGEELDLALNILQTDEQARQQWQRYQLASDVLHGHNLVSHSADLTASISSAVAGEPLLTTPVKAKVLHFSQPFWKQTMSLAVAASIGALAVVGVMSQSQHDLIATEQLATLEVEQSAVAQTTHASKRWTVEEEDVEQRLNTYLVDHNEYAGASGVFSYARVVSYEVGQ